MRRKLLSVLSAVLLLSGCSFCDFSDSDSNQECLWCHHYPCDCRAVDKKKDPPPGSVKDYLKK